MGAGTSRTHARVVAISYRITPSLLIAAGRDLFLLCTDQSVLDGKGERAMDFTLTEFERELLDLGARKIDAGLVDAPVAKIKMFSVLADLYSDLGMDDRQVELRKKQLDLIRRNL